MIETIRKGDLNYPKAFYEHSYMPEVIYAIGNSKFLNFPCMSVVGSRKCTAYGLKVAEEIGRVLAENDIVLVSGMARGIDSAAHEGALKAGGKTIAVMGTGIDKCYPASNLHIYNEIKKQGLVISEYPAGFPGQKYTFPMRNRLISALSMATIVVEAPVRSGALITAENALNQGKEVYAVPGNINSFFSFGTNSLIREGAKPLICIEDIITDFGFKLKEKNTMNVQLSKNERKIYELIKCSGEMTIDELAKACNMKDGLLVGVLTILEIKGLISNAMGKFFVEKK